MIRGRRTTWLTLGALCLSSCASSGAVGDWEARALWTEAGQSAATGVLEIDRDGEVLMRVRAAGAGFSGSIQARGVADFDEETAWLELVGDQDGRSTSVSGPCVAHGGEMGCELEVDGIPWDLELERERDALGLDGRRL